MDLNIRHVAVDKLTTFTNDALTKRRERLEELRVESRAEFTTLQDALTHAKENVEFIQSEYDNVLLAERLARGDVVRVMCPACTGTGMKPANVISGQVSKGSAFESVGKPPTAPVIDEQNRCTECKGQRWVIMERFRG